MFMKIIVIGVIVFMQLFEFLLKFLNYRNRNALIPKNVSDIYDKETYEKRSAYDMEHLRLSVTQGICNLAIIVSVLAFNIHHMFFEWGHGFTENPYLLMLIMFGMIELITWPVDIIFSAIGTFKIEAKYGFNKTNIRTFIIDRIRNFVLLTIVVGLGLVALFMYIHNIAGDWVFVVFSVVVMIIMFAVVFFMPYIFRIMYKFTPIEEGSLKEKIDALAKATGFNIKKVYSINASKRTTKLNAFFAGFGNTKTIGLYDNLIEKFTEEEVVSVLAHELGHAKGRHALKSMPFMLAQFGVMILGIWFAVGNADISTAFGFYELNLAFNFSMIISLMGPLMILLGLPASIISRKNEYEADAFEVKHGGLENAISAMKKLCRENFSNLTPHPFVVAMRYSHPTASQRIAAMEKVKL